MQQTTAVPAPEAHAVPAVLLDVERLEVFHVAVEFQRGSGSASPHRTRRPTGSARTRECQRGPQYRGAARRGQRDRARFFTLGGGVSESP